MTHLILARFHGFVIAFVALAAMGCSQLLPEFFQWRTSLRQARRLGSSRRSRLGGGYETEFIFLGTSGRFPPSII
jgi:hypothetical protein